MDVDNVAILVDDGNGNKIKQGMDLLFSILDKDFNDVVDTKEFSSPSLDLSNVKDLISFCFDGTTSNASLSIEDIEDKITVTNAD